VLKPVETVAGDKEAWKAAQDIAQAGLASASGYDAIQQYVDVDNLIDYMIVNMHAGTLDWDKSNWYAARQRTLGAGFKFFSWDAEQSMEKIKAKRTGVGNPNQPSAFYAQLRSNVEFRVRFGDHVQRHFFTDGALTPARSVARFVARAAEIDRAIVAESARWGDARTLNNPLNRDEHWLPEVEWLRLAYLPRRSAIVLDQFRDIGLYPDVEAPTLSPHGGSVAPGEALSMTAPEGIVYYTIDGSDPRMVGGAVAATAVAYAGPITIDQPLNIAARARVGGAWSALVEARFLVDRALRISELMFHPADPPSGSAYTKDDFEFVELTNVSAAPVDLTGVGLTDGISFVFPSSTLAPGDHVLVVADLSAFTSRYGAGLPVAGQYTGRLDNDGEQLTLTDATGAPLLDFSYGDRWYPQADGDGYSLVVIDPAATVSSWGTPASWRASALVGGSPGVAELPLCSNGVDDDGDGAIDYPADPGCESALSDVEDPACDDGIDNDGDGAIDLADDRCQSPAGDAEALAPIDAFACYTVRESGTAGRFEGARIELDDAFDLPQTFDVRAPRRLCLPASADGSVVQDAATALTAYPLRQASGPDHDPRSDLLVHGLGPIYLDTSRPSEVLVPSSVGTIPPVDPPLEGTHAVDRYKCYKAKTAAGSPRYFPAGVQTHLADWLDDRVYDLKKLVALCMPTALDGSTIKNDDGLLLCYQGRRARGQATHDRRFGLLTSDELGTPRLDTRRFSQMCVPAHE